MTILLFNEKDFIKSAFRDAIALGVLAGKFIEENGLKEKEPAVSKKVPRNNPCPCGSGKKYKKCHYLIDAA